MIFLQQLKRVGIYLSRWITASAICVEATPSGSIQISFGKDAPGRVSGTKKQNIEGAMGHDR
jgi:hypothetical protein